MSDEEVSCPERAVMIRLRARLAVVERAAWFGFVEAMRARPAETEAYIGAERARRGGFAGPEMARDLTEAERAMLGAEVDAGLAQAPWQDGRRDDDHGGAG